ncbi:MAG TPA: A/G-specific adenine glycosylase, partial [Thermoguttaceae bacterium]|nr:A/G-specific adenine glycosylase [Thermoguttaceae bacterium]
MDWQKGFRRRLLGWFDRNKRDLPWRRTKDPYAVWLSEIMLQQTQAPTVVRYFERFLAAFPTVHALAQADQAAVLRLWEGLGYYRRAVQLHEAARKIVSEFGGQFPQTLDELLQLPGIGRYTAGAILSIAFDQRQPILEANTLRLWARLLAYPEPTGSASAQRLFWQMAEWVLPHRQVGRFNQALMELGSTVCLPRQPRCPECPVSRFCLAR